MALKFTFLDGLYGIYRYKSEHDLPRPANDGFISLTRTRDELSLVCKMGECGEGAERKAEGYVVLMLVGPFDLDIVGILAAITKVLADVEVPIFAISTFDTDYVLIQRNDQERATTALVAAGHKLITV